MPPRAWAPRTPPRNCPNRAAEPSTRRQPAPGSPLRRVSLCSWLNSAATPHRGTCAALYPQNHERHPVTQTFDELAATIREKFPELSPQFQLAAAFLLDNPDEVAVLSMRKVAERA